MSEITIPTLRTPRLTLRGFTAADLPAYAAMMADPAVTRFLGTGETRSRAETWESMARALGLWALRGHGLFAVEHAGRFAGHCGLLQPLHWPQPELAYALAPEFHGKGLATEAAQAVRAWAAGQQITDLFSYIRPENAASIALARRLGATREADAELMGLTAQVWRHGPPPTSPAAPAAASVTQVETLSTDRLILRRFERTDFEPLCAIHADAETMRHLGDGKPRDPVLTGQQMAMWTGGFALGTGGLRAIIRRSDGALIGRCGINGQPAWPEPEIAYTLARAAWGQGYASEAAAAVRDWAWRSLAPDTLVSFVKVGNTASARVAARLGATLTGVFEFEGKPTERWEYPRP